MPKGRPKKRKAVIPPSFPRPVEVTIEATGEEPQYRGRFYSHLDQLISEREADVFALRRAREIFQARDRTRAMMEGPQKLMAATQHRRTAAAALPPARVNGREAPSQRRTRGKDYGFKVRAKLELAKTRINGPRLMLFFLENIPDSGGITGPALYQRLAEAGTTFPNGHVGMNGVLSGQLLKAGLIRRNLTGEYRRLTSGTRMAHTVRRKLEQKGLVVPGGYLVPNSWQYRPVSSTEARAH